MKILFFFQKSEQKLYKKRLKFFISFEFSFLNVGRKISRHLTRELRIEWILI